jgi:hypothetical protein
MGFLSERPIERHNGQKKKEEKGKQRSTKLKTRGEHLLY